MSRILSALVILAFLCAWTAAFVDAQTPSQSTSPEPAPASIRAPVSPPAEEPATEPAAEEEKKYRFERGDRRDPFRPAMIPLAGEAAPGAGIVRYYTKEEEEENYLAAQDLAAQIHQLASQNQHAKVVELYNQLSNISPRRFANEAYRLEVKKTQERLLPFFRKSQLVLLLLQGEALLATMERHLESNDYDKVLEYASQLETLVVGTEPLDPGSKARLGELVAKAFALRDRAQARKEFAKLEIDISAIAWTAENPAALINNITVRPGDFIGDQLKIFKIDERSVTFLYKGEHITRNLETIKPTIPK